MGAFNLGDCKISYFHIHLQLLAQLFFVAVLLTWTKDLSIPKGFLNEGVEGVIPKGQLRVFLFPFSTKYEGVSCVTKVSYMI